MGGLGSQIIAIFMGNQFNHGESKAVEYFSQKESNAVKKYEIKLKRK